MRLLSVRRRIRQFLRIVAPISFAARRLIAGLKLAK
jgi:hypothetical protein